jgi:hypothetical protein
MVTAHKLEKGKVIHPRFIVDPACEDRLITANLSSDKKIVFRRDTDGCMYYNFFYELLLNVCIPGHINYNPIAIRVTFTGINN